VKVLTNRQIYMEISGSIYVRCQDLAEAKKSLKMFNAKKTKIEIYTKYMCNYESFVTDNIDNILGYMLSHCDQEGRVARKTKITNKCIDRICIEFTF